MGLIKPLLRGNIEREDSKTEVARSAGIEPTTPAFGGQYSIH